MILQGSSSFTADKQLMPQRWRLRCALGLFMSSVVAKAPQPPDNSAGSVALSKPPDNWAGSVALSKPPRTSAGPAIAPPPAGCIVTVGLSPRPRVVTGRAAGILNGLNLTAPAATIVAPLRLSMWRGPMASWLWPNRTACKGPGTCCTPLACAAPFAEAGRLAALGLRQQYILNGIHTGMGDCEWVSFNREPH